MLNINTKKVYVAKSTLAQGNGVFAVHDLRKGETVEVCPAIFLPMKEFELIKKTKLYYYFYEYSNKEFAIVLGYGSVYNHSYTPNAEYKFNYLRRVYVVKAIMPIKKDEEILINYNYYSDDMTPLEGWYSEGVDKNHLG
jgi:hypothetical protein